MAKESVSKSAKNDQPTRPPVVVVMGHVDHGKTSLLDYIRKSHVVEKETGAITQHIGAYQVDVPSKDGSHKITFIDTPGHAAFTAMRKRGVTVADIAILVVAADDSVKPQTIEAIQIIKEAGIPMIVAINKTDLPQADIAKTKKDLATNEVFVEGFGGNVPVAEISAKTGKNVDELLELIQLVAQLEELPDKPNDDLIAAVIESRVDKGRGAVATVIVQQGTIKASENYFVESAKFKVRTLLNDLGKQIAQAIPSTPIEVVGLPHVPQVGSVITQKAEIQTPQVQQDNKGRPIQFNVSQNSEVAIVLKADVAGSLEAIEEQVKLMEGNNLTLRIASSKIGDINESDIIFAKAARAFILGFNVRIQAQARQIAQVEGVPYKIYGIIYELLDDVQALLESGAAQLAPKPKGQADVIAIFPAENKIILGVKVSEGRFRLGESVTVLRNDESIGSGKIKTLRHVKEDVKEISKNLEAGMVLDPQVEVEVGDVIQYAP